MTKTDSDSGFATPVDAASDGLPVIELRDPADGQLDVLQALPKALLMHPAAGQAAFNALLAEGRRYAKTAEGQALKARLEKSELLHRARLVFDFATLSLLEDEPPNALPSSLIDVIFMLSSDRGADHVLELLFREVKHDD